MSATHRVRPRLECLEERALLSGVVNEVEFNGRRSSATAFNVPADGLLQLQGDSINHDDKDFFRFTATQTTTLNVNVQAANGVFAQLEVENAAGVNLFETEPNHGVNHGSVPITAGATYFIRLRSPAAFSAQYLVELGFGTDVGGGGGGGGGGSVVDETEFNGKRGSANPFVLDATGKAQLRGSSVNKADKDFFRFTAPQSGTLTVTVASTNGIMAKLEATNAAGNKLFQTEPNDGINSGSFQVTAGQSYWIRLRSPLEAAAGYNVDLSLA